jgi:hypothetical protein
MIVSGYANLHDEVAAWLSANVGERIDGYLPEVTMRGRGWEMRRYFSAGDHAIPLSHHRSMRSYMVTVDDPTMYDLFRLRWA